MTEAMAQARKNGATTLKYCKNKENQKYIISIILQKQR